MDIANLQHPHTGTIGGRDLARWTAAILAALMDLTDEQGLRLRLHATQQREILFSAIEATTDLVDGLRSVRDLIRG